MASQTVQLSGVVHFPLSAMVSIKSLTVQSLQDAMHKALRHRTVVIERRFVVKLPNGTTNIASRRDGQMKHTPSIALPGTANRAFHTVVSFAMPSETSVGWQGMCAALQKSFVDRRIVFRKFVLVRAANGRLVMRQTVISNTVTKTSYRPVALPTITVALRKVLQPGNNTAVASNTRALTNNGLRSSAPSPSPIPHAAFIRELGDIAGQIRETEIRLRAAQAALQRL